MRRVHKYADGGKVKTDHIAAEKKKQQAAAKRPDPKMLGSGMAAGAAEALKSGRKKQMEELGLRDGGKVKRKC